MSHLYRINTRQYTNELLQLVDDGMFDARTVLRDLLNWTDELDVESFCHSNGYIASDDDDDDDD